jgi:hypothetical protein
MNETNQNTNENTNGAAPVGNVVTMKDGRPVDFGKRGKQKAHVTILGEGAERRVIVSFDVPNGDTHQIEVGLDHVLVAELLGYGIKQKIADTLTGADDPDDISLAIERAISQLNEGKWSQRSSEGSSIRGFADLYEAYLTVKGITDPEGEYKRKLLAQPEEVIKTLRNNTQIKAVMANITARKAAERAAKLAGANASNSNATEGLIDL